MVKKIRDFPRSVKYGIKNLIIWFPIIWKDRNWDHWFLYKMLKFKLSRMEKYHRKYGIALRSEIKANEMKTCVNLLDRLIEDNYGDMTFKKHNEKWGEIEIDWVPYKDRDDLVKCLITRTNVKDEEDEKLERKQFIRLCKHESNLIKQDIEYLFNIMNKQIQSWWD